MDLSIKGKKVIITGSSKGIGFAIAKLYSIEGAKVLISSRSKNDLIEAKNEIEEVSNNEIFYQTCDLMEKNGTENFFLKALDKLGGADILINNAGIWPKSYVVDMEDEEFEKTLYLNLEVPYILSKMFVNYLIDNNKKGKIINVSSQAAFNGSTTGHAHYAASKAGLITFMKSLAREVAQYGITINSVVPGIVNTDMMRDKYLANKSYYDKRIPIGRIAEKEDIANVVLFLGSKLSDYMTGSSIDVTGGMIMR